ncbi:PTS sugar transporter subunit IIA [Oceanobacillus manasiensis]|uniref:PTS sugar transporter subunit IIA n=1 Tax=Oceanobacillus manasiensis TaxID=586413 RepID=UPI0005A8472D|nr:PTS sugar transporter subunit IIA [Oceanobacillus manasiensis]
MRLEDILDDRIMEVNLDAENKDQAITILSQKLKEANYIHDVEAFKKDIYLRETQGSTGIGNYIAIPHGQSESVYKIGVAIGKFKNEIEWETLDGKGVKVVCLFAVNNGSKSAEEHLQLLAQFATKLGNDAAVETLLNAESVKEIKNVFLMEEYV